jgi:hypothetical protein
MLKMISTYQCPGCMLGSAPAQKCSAFKPVDAGGHVQCMSHVTGTSSLGGGRMALGLPKGFNKVGARLDDPFAGKQTTNIRIWPKGSDPGWNKLNVPIWAMEHEGNLFVRTYCPRVNVGYVDIIEGGEFSALAKNWPGVFNVHAFIEEID